MSSNWYCRDERECTPLHYAAAAYDNSDQLVALLIDAGADIKPKDVAGVRMLMQPMYTLARGGGGGGTYEGAVCMS